MIIFLVLFIQHKLHSFLTITGTPNPFLRQQSYILLDSQIHTLKLSQVIAHVLFFPIIATIIQLFPITVRHYIQRNQQRNEHLRNKYSEQTASTVPALCEIHLASGGLFGRSVCSALFALQADIINYFFIIRSAIVSSLVFLGKKLNLQSITFICSKC